MKHSIKISALALAAVVLGACGGDSPVDPIVPTAHDPIIFVHGLGGSASNWDQMVARFRADGWTERELVRSPYSSLQSNASIAEDIRARVDSVLAATGSSKVDIVTHSMGGVSSRYYIKNLGGASKVDAWVSLAGPNHGTTTASNCTVQPCIEIRPGSAFLTALNAGDETPGTVRYGTWRSPCDATIDPDDSVMLAGAALNTLTGCMAHAELLINAAVYSQVRTFIAP